MSRWRKISVNDAEFKWDAIDQKPGVYAIYCDGLLMYVGQSSRVRYRLQVRHKIRHAYSNSVITPWGFFRRVDIKIRYSRKFAEELTREARIIRRAKPLMNISGNNTGRPNLTKVSP